MIPAPRARVDARWLWAVPIYVAVAYVAGEALTAWRDARLPRNLAVAAPGALVRAGQLSTAQLDAACARQGVGLVVCLNPGKRADEAAQAAARGLGFAAFSMPGNGLGEPAQFHELLRAIAARQPAAALVHCSAGAMRTGVAVAACRVVFEGWSVADAAAELNYYGTPWHKVPELRQRLAETIATLPPDLQALRDRGPAAPRADAVRLARPARRAVR